MKFRIHLLWKILVPLNRAHAAAVCGNLFNIAGGKSFARRLGGDFALEGTPMVLSPTDLFHSALKPIRRELGLHGARFPYLIQSAAGLEHNTINVAVHLHEGALCLTVRLAPFFVRSTDVWFSLQDIRGHPVLWPLTRRILDLVVTGNSTDRFGREPQILPAIHIQALDQDPEDWLSKLVSVVTRHENVIDDVVNAVVDKNLTHRVDQTLLLVDKQGVAAYVPSQTTEAATKANLNRFEQSVAMLQLAGALRVELRDGRKIASDATRAILDPSSVITASVSGRRIWSLFVQEFNLAALLNNVATNHSKKALTKANSMPVQNVSPCATLMRVLLITVTTTETRALKEAISAATGSQPSIMRVDGFSYQSYGAFGEYELFHQISGMGSGGVDGSQESVRRGIQAIQPNVILMIGIAFGVDPEKQPIGTILVSRQIQAYELQRVNCDSSIVLRGDKTTAAPRLLDWVSHAEIDWPEGSAKIKKGLILSGEKLIDNKDYRDQLLQVAPEAIGGEMEGAGLYVASRTAHIDWLLVKAVCDWADGNKAKDKDELQATAAKSAAEFCVHMLRANSAIPVPPLKQMNTKS